MESLFIWGITALIVIVIFIPYLKKVHKQHKIDIERKQEAKKLGIDRPMSQFPFIDMARCIGCGSCVSACPEGDVLGVVYGKATIINGLRCVGHAMCEPACPVGAIKVGLGDVTTREDIPILTEHNETSIPGIYIAGELGGLALIRNAITQGRKVIEKIVNEMRPALSDDIKDVIIVGAGPAGLSAALTARQNNLSFVVLDQQDPGGTILQYPRGKLVMTQSVELPLFGTIAKAEYQKEALLNMWQELIDKFELPILSGEKVLDVQKENGFFEVITAGHRHRGGRVVLALGRRGSPRKLDVPGEDKKKVLYQLIDAQSYKHKHILVVGGGDSAVEAAIGLARQKGNSVTISYRKSQFFRIKKNNQERIDDMIRSKKVHPEFDSTVVEIKDHSIVLKTTEGLKEIQNDHVFIFAGGEPPFKMLKEMGIAFGGEMKQIA